MRSWPFYKLGMDAETVDARFEGTPIEVNFKGDLRPPRRKSSPSDIKL